MNAPPIHPGQRLTDAEVPGLRYRLRHGLSTVHEEADRYGVGVESIRRANRGDTFRHVREGLETPLSTPERDRLEAEADASLKRLTTPPPSGLAPGLNGEDEVPPSDPVADFLEARKKE